MKTDSWAATGAGNAFSKGSEVRRRRYRSRITNGRTFLSGVDGRSTWVKRARDVHRQLVLDRGGPAAVSEAETLIARRAAVLEAELERFETIFAKEGQAEHATLCLYQTLSNCQRRLLETLGLERRPRDITDVGPTLPAVSDEDLLQRALDQLEDRAAR